MNSKSERGFVRVRGAREHNLKNVDVDVPRDALVVFTGVSGSGKSSLAFGTLYAEAQRRYLESVAPYARRLFHQLGVPAVDSIDGLPPAVALQQQRGTPTTRSSVGSVTTLSNLLRMLYSRAGEYPRGQPLLYAESFSPNTPEGACPECHGVGRVFTVTERLMVPDDTKTLRERAVASWPQAWGGQNLRDILTSMNVDVDVPWKSLPRKTRDFILFTEEHPTAPVYAGYDLAQTQRALKRKEEPSYMGTFTGARRHVLHTYANTQSALMKRRAAQFMEASACGTCGGKRLKPEALSVTFDGLDIATLSRMTLSRMFTLFGPYAAGTAKRLAALERQHPEQAEVTRRIAADLCARLQVLLDLGLGYLTLERSTPTLSPGELQRLRLATQVRSNLFGVVYVLDEPSAGLHPVDTEALLRALGTLKAAGNSLFVVEHELDVIRRADWLVDVGPGAGQHGGQVLYSGPPEGLRDVAASRTARHLFATPYRNARPLRIATEWLKLRDVTRNNLQHLDVDLPLGLLTSVTGVSGSGKSSLVSQVLVELVSQALGVSVEADEEAEALDDALDPIGGRIEGGLGPVKRLIRVDQRPIGRTPRSNLATYTGLFDHVRRLFAETKAARARQATTPAAFPSTSPRGAAPKCEGEGFVFVELLFLPSVYAPCPDLPRGALQRQARWRSAIGRTSHIADVLALTVDADALGFLYRPEPSLRRIRSKPCATSAWAICAWASPRRSFPAAKRSASSSPPNCSAKAAAGRSTCSTSPPPASGRAHLKELILGGKSGEGVAPPVRSRCSTSSATFSLSMTHVKSTESVTGSQTSWSPPSWRPSAAVTAGTNSNCLQRRNCLG